MKKSWFAILLVLGVLFVTGLTTSESRGIIFDLVFGWIGYLARVARELRVRWDGVAIFAVALILFFVLLHGFLRWLSSALTTPDAPVRPWRWRSTAAIVLVIVVMFWAGVSMIGVAHQTIWLATDPAPMFGTMLRHWPGSSSDSNLKQIGLGLHNYHDRYRAFPPGASGSRHSWVTYSLPYMMYMSEIDLARDWDDPVNQNYFRSVLPEFINPEFRTAPVVDENGFGLNHYAGNSHLLAQEYGVKLDDIADGTSGTLMAGEVNADFVPWGHPENCRDPIDGINAGRNGFGGPGDRRGALFVMADGSVRLIEEKIDAALLKSLATPNGDD
jgi:hypothetical protein